VVGVAADMMVIRCRNPFAALISSYSCSTTACGDSMPVTLMYDAVRLKEVCTVAETRLRGDDGDVAEDG
jgi:hypothetical protein